MAENSGTDPAVDRNAEENAASSGTIIMVTVKTPKDKEEIAISEDASVAQVRCTSSSRNAQRVSRLLRREWPL